MSSDPLFLTGHQIRSEVELSLAGASCADLAVAYWGDNALPLLINQDWKKPVRIICDLMSGFCHVETIRKLRSATHIEVRMSQKLHAKIYWTPRAVIIGSANASHRGLYQPWCNKEAALRTRSKAIISETRHWFETQWTVAANITDPDLLAASKRAEQLKNFLPPRPPVPPLTKEQEFLAKLTPEARQAVMSWASSQQTVKEIRFGTTGEGEQPNFQAIYQDDSRLSYYFPAEGKAPERRQPEWSDANLTAPIPVFRSAE